MNNPTSGTVNISRSLLERISTGMWYSEDRKRLFDEIEAVLAQSAEQQQEPVAFMYSRPEVEWPVISEKRMDKGGWTETPLYRYPPVQQRTEEQERAEFEAWHTKLFFPEVWAGRLKLVPGYFDRYEKETYERGEGHIPAGEYVRLEHRQAFAIWKARIALDTGAVK